jgi:surface polysaccharide O-acyltransferase-like enzyme
VVFIHNTVIDRGINFADGTRTFTVPLYVSKIKEFIGTFTCTAVPLYFLTASVFLYSREISYKDNIKKKCRTIVLPYFLWTALEIVFLAAAQNISSAKPYFANLIIKDFSVWDWLGAFTGKSGMFAVSGHPLNYPLWFLRDLFILNIFSPVIKKITDIFPAGAFAVFFIA